ncbi:MAG: divalent-cation tolerance protein CutA [bacterium]|jgi:periplasmic divalent cation tolerance protein|nr:divalent-cation tolerance protein CutA [bacterium]MBK9473184.1 divalent-cation tolerance protein CutA [bacterium]MBK9775424.1 divalent-cation tolerance protein CutA [bacterium]
MSANELMILTTTFPDRETAERVVGLLVDGGLAVCGQVGADLTSFYRWEGALCRTAEVAAVIKVLPERFDLCVGELKLQHPYDIPQMVAWPSSFVSRDYLAWAQGAGR